jgi:hypothetical protein
MEPTSADPKIPYDRTPILFDISLLTRHDGHNKWLPSLLFLRARKLYTIKPEAHTLN